MSTSAFTDADRCQMEKLGISEAEAMRQLAVLSRGYACLRLLRPCTLGDGIAVVESSEKDRLLERWRSVAAAGRLAKFVPASGAATRMFAFLQRLKKRFGRVTEAKINAAAGDADEDCRALRQFLQGLPEFAFFEPLVEAMANCGISLEQELNSGDYTEILNFLLGPSGLNYRLLPKALIPFHRYPDHSRTALEEHLAEAPSLVLDDNRCCRIHFTLAPESEAAVKEHAREAAAVCASRFGVHYDLGFSVQSPASNTLAVDLENRPFRQADGSLRFRPGGHGALLQNLNQLQGDLVFIKNIDNVVPDHRRDSVVYHERVLVGLLVELQDKIFRYLRQLDSNSGGPGLLEEALRFAVERLGAAQPAEFSRSDESAKISWLFRFLHRPLRVCGMVKNRGEPGGGPFWVKQSTGEVSLQIVEAAQVDRSSPEQLAIFESSTHFNPVQIVCGVRDFRGEPFDLSHYADPEAVIVTRKSEAGRELKVLELPGLWNGGMAYWNTVFAEIPEESFNPVKTINDLLRSGHRSAVRKMNSQFRRGAVRSKLRGAL